MMTTTRFAASLLCSSSAAASLCKSKFASKTAATVDFGGKTIGASSSSITNSIPYGNSEENRIDKSDAYGRRRLLFLSSMPFLLPHLNFVEGISAVAADHYFLIQSEVRKVLTKGKAAGVLRLVFHDAGTFEVVENSGGMNGSIVYELDRRENSGLRKSLKLLEKAKSEVDLLRPVSWADMIAVAGAEAVSLCGGPKITVQLGRIDSMLPDAEGKLPEESLDAPGLKQCFQRKGFLTQELVVLSGAHTLGSKGFGNPNVFDNSYFKILLERPWSSSGSMSSMIGLPSDRALVADDECLRWISKYADNQNLFFEDFRDAYIKLVNSGARWRKSSSI